MKIQILYGSEGGNAQGIALKAGKVLSENGYEIDVKEANQMSYEELKACNQLIMVTSTTGEGDPPQNAEKLYEELEMKENSDLEQMNYAVYGLGQEYFEYFCKAGKDFDEFLANCGAKRLLPVETCDDDYEERFGPWMEKLLSSLGSINK